MMHLSLNSIVHMIDPDWYGTCAWNLMLDMNCASLNKRTWRSYSAAALEQAG